METGEKGRATRMKQGVGRMSEGEAEQVRVRGRKEVEDGGRQSLIEKKAVSAVHPSSSIQLQLLFSFICFRRISFMKRPVRSLPALSPVLSTPHIRSPLIHALDSPHFSSLPPPTPIIHSPSASHPFLLPLPFSPLFPRFLSSLLSVLSGAYVTSSILISFLSLLSLLL